MKFQFFLILLFSAGIATSQCLCGDIYFQVIIPGIEFKNGVSQYNIQSNYEVTGVGAQSYEGRYNLSNRPVFESECKRDTFYFLVGTGGGIDSLHFTIRNELTGKQMTVINRHLGYDEWYCIDLSTFQDGVFRFDWIPIAKCLLDEPTVKEINCKGQRIFHFKENYKFIRPVDMDEFKVG